MFSRRTNISQAWKLCSVKSMNLSYKCLTSAEVKQAILGLRLTNPMLYEEITAPPASTLPVPPPGSDGTYTEDKEDVGQDNDEQFIDSSLSVDEAISQILDLPNTQVPIDVYGSDDEGVDGYDEGVDGHDESGLSDS